MKKTIAAVMAFAVALVSLPLAPAQAATLAQRLSGRILLQVQNNGEAWYVNPVNTQRYYMGRPADAFQLMRSLGLGISETDLNNFGTTTPARLAGRILLRVQAHGEAYYVAPQTRKMLYLGRPADAFRIMREQGLGITTTDLNSIPRAGTSAIPPGSVVNITVAQPAVNATIGLPATISGQARVFESTVHIRIRNGNGTELVEVTTTANAPDAGQYGPFSAAVHYPAPTTQTGTVEVFNISAKDGSEINKVIIPVRFATVAANTVKVYFTNTKEDPNRIACGTTLPVNRRVAETSAIATAAINQLLMGPTVNEASSGYTTNIPNTVQLRSLRIENGTAYADFNSALNAGGSCRVAGIRSQITNTLKQFSTVTNVVISVNGNTTGVLQP